MSKFKYMSMALLATIILNAQPVDPPADDDPPAPISQYVIYLLLVGVSLGFYFIQKNKAKKITLK